MAELNNLELGEDLAETIGTALVESGNLPPSLQGIGDAASRANRVADGLNTATSGIDRITRPDNPDVVLESGLTSREIQNRAFEAADLDHFIIDEPELTPAPGYVLNRNIQVLSENDPAAIPGMLENSLFGTDEPTVSEGASVRLDIREERASDAANAAAEEEFGADSFGFIDFATTDDFNDDGGDEDADLASAEAAFGTTDDGLIDFPGANDFDDDDGGSDGGSDFGGSGGSYPEPGDFNSPEDFGVSDPF
ncbi:hypothetical protein OCH239_10770 [Roseivivax halodurans JCM 10272]|uniref:Uncharacterized protein n=1 Tax=Roseivivax halodurans JCM 10272 TaxID=1449350 RepID=X7EBI8_9RHOB|nr:hypothetical protein [Roseivivax halodurans]ETX13317.1 hypothetical protein OCH239_10770 [Roseivivax halodurans JCM 10272]